MRRKFLITVTILIIFITLTITAALLNTSTKTTTNNTTTQNLTNNTNNNTTQETQHKTNTKPTTKDVEEQKFDYTKSQPTKTVDSVEYKLMYDDNDKPSHWQSMDGKNREQPLKKNKKT